MPKELAQRNGVFKRIFLKFVTLTLPTMLISVLLFAGGIFLLWLRIPFWSLLLGLPSVQIGIIFFIFTFDEIIRTRAGKDSLHLVNCPRCHRPTLAPYWQSEKYCQRCLEANWEEKEEKTKKNS